MVAQKLVGGTQPDWDDMSPFVVHFTKAANGKSEYENSMSILSSRRPEARNPFGIGKNYLTAPRAADFQVEANRRSIFLFEHRIFPKPVPTFGPDALDACVSVRSRFTR